MIASTTLTSDTSEFNGKRVLVTGGTKGAGKAIADRFLRGGGTVMITARSAPEEETGSYLDGFKGVDIIVHNVGGSQRRIYHRHG